MTVVAKKASSEIRLLAVKNYTLVLVQILQIVNAATKYPAQVTSHVSMKDASISAVMCNAVQDLHVKTVSVFVHQVTVEILMISLKAAILVDTV